MAAARSASFATVTISEDEDSLSTRLWPSCHAPLTFLRVDRGWPRLGRRPDEVVERRGRRRKPEVGVPGPRLGPSARHGLRDHLLLLSMLQHDSGG